MHITTSVLFLIAGIWHTWYNWTPLMQYLRGIPNRMTASWRDLAIAGLVTAFFTVGAVTKTPPLNYILNFNNWIKESWVKTPADDPPFGHAELLSLKGFCKKMYIDTGEAIRELRQAGMSVSDENMTVEQIALTNKMTPANVYQVIKKLERPDVPTAAVATAMPALSLVTEKSVPAVPNAAKDKYNNLPASKAVVDVPRYTGDIVIEKFEGKGIGKKTLLGICQELHLDNQKIQQKLAARQMAIKEDETLKDAATRLGVVPIEVLKTILVGEPM
jgi:hypothetical protein